MAGELDMTSTAVAQATEQGIIQGEFMSTK